MMVFWTRWIAEVVINGHILKVAPTGVSGTLNVDFEGKDVNYHNFIVCGLDNWKNGLAMN